MENKQRIIALALITNDVGQVLLQLRKDKKFPEADNKWEFPGGGVEFREAPEQTVVRECLEEIGCEVKIVRLIPLIGSNLWNHIDGYKFQAVLICYECRIMDGVARPQVEEVKETRWCRKEEVYMMDCLPWIKEFVRML